MAKTPHRPFSSADVDPDTMDKARAAAVAKKARLLAEQELGIGEPGAGVVKGPAPIKDEEMVTLHLELAPHSLELRIDSKIYRHGQVITVPYREAKSIMEMVSAGWRHQEEIDGKTHNFYKPRTPILSGKAA